MFEAIMSGSLREGKQVTHGVSDAAGAAKNSRREESMIRGAMRNLWAVHTLAFIALLAPAAQASSVDDAKVRVDAAKSQLQSCKDRVVASISQTAPYVKQKAIVDTAAVAREKARVTGSLQERLDTGSYYNLARAALGKIIDAALAKDTEYPRDDAQLKQAESDLEAAERGERAATAASRQLNETERELADVADKVVTVDYDKFKDVTTVRTIGQTSLTLSKGRSHHSYQIAVAGNGKDVPTQPQSVRWWFLVSGSDWNYLYDRDSFELIAIADGQKIEVKPTDFDSRIGDGPVCIEYFAFDLTAAQFRAIALASKVECQVDNQEFSLSDDDLALFKLFGAKIHLLHVASPGEK
jgi:hypothetical protein